MNLGRRKSQHLYKLRRNNHDNQKLQNYYNKYGEELFSFNILEVIDDSYEIVRTREQEYFNKYFAQEYVESGFKDKRFDDLLLNVTPEVDIMRVHWTDERRETLRKRNSDFEWTEERRAMISRANKGRKRSAEDKKNKSDAEDIYWKKQRLLKDRKCPMCKGNHIRKMGIRLNARKNIYMQKHKCMDCNKCYSKPVDTGTSHSDV